MRLPVLAIVLFTLILAGMSLSQNTRGDTLDTSIHLDVFISKKVYLPYEKLKINYTVYQDNGRVVKGGMGKWYFNNTENNSCIVNGSLVSSHGLLIIDMSKYNITPMGAKGQFGITLIYNVSNISVKKSVGVILVNPLFFSYEMYTSPAAGGYYPGSFVTVHILSEVGGIKVDFINVHSGNTTILNLTSLVIGNSGGLDYNFKLPDYLHPGEKVNVTSRILNHTREYSFTVEKYYGFNLVLNGSETLISGDTLGIAVTNVSHIERAYFHFYVKDVFGRLLYRHYSSRNFTRFHIPLNFTGYLRIVVDIYNDTTLVGELTKYREVKAAYINVFFNRENYREHDSFRAIVDFRSNVMRKPTFVYVIYASYDGVYYDEIRRMQTHMREINITVPENAPLAYKVQVIAIDHNFVEKAQSFIYYSNIVGIKAYIITRSPYSTGVYTPGEMIEIVYNITGEFRNGVLYYGFGTEFFTNPSIKLVKSGASGSILVEIPKNIHRGIYEFHIKLVYDGGEASKTVLVPVDDNPPWSQYLILTLPAGDFVAILLIAVLIIAGAIFVKYPHHKRKMEISEKERQSEIKDEILEEESES